MNRMCRANFVIKKKKSLITQPVWRRDQQHQQNTTHLAESRSAHTEESEEVFIMQFKTLLILFSFFFSNSHCIRNVNIFVVRPDSSRVRARSAQAATRKLPKKKNISSRSHKFLMFDGIIFFFTAKKNFFSLLRTEISVLAYSQPAKRDILENHTVQLSSALSIDDSQLTSFHWIHCCVSLFVSISSCPPSGASLFSQSKLNFSSLHCSRIFLCTDLNGLKLRRCRFGSCAGAIWILEGR